jgi:hypothetical protein
MFTPDEPPASGRTPAHRAGEGVLCYAAPVGTQRPAWRDAVILGLPLCLTGVALGILARAANDEGPFGPGLSQSGLYLGAALLVLISWAGWAFFFVRSLVRREVSRTWTLLLIIGLLWAAPQCCALYLTAAQYIDQTSRIHGASWPVLEKVFRR